jgi:hypothetical protein
LAVIAAAILAVGGMVAGLVAVAGSAAGSTVTVPCTSVPTTDGAALLAAVNAHASGDTVVLAAGCTYTLDTAGFNSFGDTLTLQGNGATINRSSGNNFRFFDLSSGGNLTVSNVTFNNGNPESDGGAIFTSDASLTITNSTFTNNVGGDGGAIAVEGGLGTVIITGSTFSANTASTDGGALHDDTTMTVINSTFTGNTATDGGAFSDFDATGPATLINDTFSGNTTTGGAGHGTVENANESVSTLTVTNSIVSNNAGNNCANTITDGGYNLEHGTTCAFANHAVNADPALAALANNGGPTQTRAISTTSPAFDTANLTVCTATTPAGAGDVDQRGLTRTPSAGTETACDIGAFEVQVAAAPTQPTTPITPPAAAPVTIAPNFTG